MPDPRLIESWINGDHVSIGDDARTAQPSTTDNPYKRSHDFLCDNSHADVTDQILQVHRALSQAMDALESDDSGVRAAAFAAIQELYEPGLLMAEVACNVHTCPECHGSGRADNHVTGEIECSACAGSGVETTDNTGASYAGLDMVGDDTPLDEMPEMSQDPLSRCPDCDGTGLLRNDLVSAGPDEYQCRTCHGSGVAKAHMCDPSTGCGLPDLVPDDTYVPKPYYGQCSARDLHGSACVLDWGHGGPHHSTSGVFN